MPAPTLNDVNAYLDSDESGWADDDVSAALEAEKAAQARVCTVPGDDDEWPSDLAEALFRRVAANLAVRALPLGLQSSIGEFGVTSSRVGGGDREVARLEAPFRVIPVA